MRGMAGPLVKLVVFALVTILAAYVLISTITNAGYGEQTVYRAQFTDVAGLVEGDEIRIAGVRVGQVVSIGLVPDQTDRPVAEVELEVDADVPLPSGVQATIRYRNLVGQRYIALTEGDGAGGETLDANAVIPLAQTKPALDLTTLFGGFQPLLTALNPEDMNRLSFEIIQVFQGEGGTVESLLSPRGLADELAGRQGRRHRRHDRQPDDGAVQRGPARPAAVQPDRRACSSSSPGWPSDRDAIFDSLQTIDTLATTTTDFLAEARAPLSADIEALGDLSTNLAEDGELVEDFLQLAPTKIDLITRTAINGSWFNFFMCSSNATVTLPATGLPGNEQETGVLSPTIESGAEGCS